MVSHTSNLFLSSFIDQYSISIARTPSTNFLSLPREIRDIILEYAISTREVTFRHTSVVKEPPRGRHGFGWDMLAPKSPQNDPRAAFSGIEPLNTTSNRPTRRAPTASEIRISIRGSGLGLLTTCHQLHQETAQLLYSDKCTTFRFWSIHALLSFLHCVGDNAAYLREAFLRIELKWDDQHAARKPRIHMQSLLRQATERLGGLRYLDLAIWMDHLECIPGNWSERRPSNPRAPMGLREMFGPLKSIATLDHVDVKIQTDGTFQSAAVKSEILAVKQGLQDGLSRALNSSGLEEEPPSPEQMPRIMDDDWQEEDYEDCAFISRTVSRVSETFSVGDNDGWAACCAQQ